MEAYTIEKGMLSLGGSAFPTSSSTLSFERHQGLHEPPPPPPPPRWVPPLDRCSPLVDSLRTPDDHDFHHGIPPPPPPPASSPAVRMRGGRVTYINPSGAYDIPV